MSQIDTSGWKPVGETSICSLFAVTPDLVAVVPKEGARDTAETARELTTWQYGYWKRLGHTGAVAVFVDRYVDQDPAARDVYVQDSEGALTYAAVIIGGTFWGRTVGTAYLAVRKQPIPTRFFGTLEEAMPWLEQMKHQLRPVVGRE
jgi:hypothetical protein